MPSIAKSLPLVAVAFTLLWSATAAEAKSSTPRASTHATHASSHHSSAHASGRTARNPKSSGGTRFIRGTCKTATCKKKHPSGTYLIPLKPKKKG